MKGEPVDRLGQGWQNLGQGWQRNQQLQQPVPLWQQHSSLPPCSPCEYLSLISGRASFGGMRRLSRIQKQAPRRPDGVERSQSSGALQAGWTRRQSMMRMRMSAQGLPHNQME